jgi:transposase-like protein
MVIMHTTRRFVKILFTPPNYYSVMTRRNITKKAAAIAAMDSTDKPAGQVAKALNISRSTLYNWKREAKANPALADAVQLERAELAGKYYRLAGGLADALIDQLPAANFENKAVTALATAADKWLALTGQAQTITESRVSGSIDLVIEARRAVQLYIAEGFTESGAVECLRDDDPELYRALLSASHAAAD